MTTHIFVQGDDFPQKDIIMNSLAVPASKFDGSYIPNLKRVGFLWMNMGKTMPFGTSFPAQDNIHYFTQEVVAFLSQYENIKVDLITCSISKVQIQSDLLNLNAGVARPLNFYKTNEINYSVNLTGNPQDGGDWVMESNGENIKSIYFTENILNYTDTLDLPLVINIPDLAVYYKFNTSDVSGVRIADYSTGTPSYNAYILGLGTAQTPWTASVSGKLANGNTVVLSNIADVAVSGQRCVVCDNTRHLVFFSQFNGASWSELTQILEPVDASNNITSVELTNNGQTCIVAKQNNYVYISTWDVSNSNFSVLTQTQDTVARNYKNLAASADGTTLVAVDASNVYFTNLDGSGNYASFMNTLETNSRPYYGVGLTADASKLVYSEQGGNVYVASWNGSNYTAGVKTISATHSFFDIKFSPIDSNLIYAVEGGNSNGVLWYSTWNDASGNYTDFVSLQKNIIPAQTNVKGLAVSSDNCLFVSTPTSVYRLPITGINSPLPPTNLAFSEYNSLDFLLTFTQPIASNILYYTAIATPIAGGTPVVHKFVNTTSYLLDGLTPSTTYSVALTVTTADGTSIPVVMNATTKDTPAAPSVVTSLAASSVTTSSFQISWVPPSEPVYDWNISFVYIDLSGNVSNGGNVAIHNNNTTTYALSGLYSNTEYTVYITGINETGRSPAASLTVVTLPNPPVLTSISDITSTGAKVNFTPPYGSVSSYTLTAVPNYGANIVVNNITSSPAILTNFPTNTAYSVSMVAKHSSASSAASNTLNFVLGQGPPTAVSTSSVSYQDLVVNFTAPSGSIQYYTITLTPADGSSSVSAQTTSLSYQMTGLTPAVMYSVTVTATSAVGTSTPSVPVSVKTLAFWIATPYMHFGSYENLEHNDGSHFLADSMEEYLYTWEQIKLNSNFDASGNMYFTTSNVNTWGTIILMAPDYTARKFCAYKYAISPDSFYQGAFDKARNILYTSTYDGFLWTTTPGDEESVFQGVGYGSIPSSIATSIYYDFAGNQHNLGPTMACDSSGNIYAVGWSGKLYKFAPYFTSGALLCGGGSDTTYNNISPTSARVSIYGIQILSNNDIYLQVWGTILKISAATGLLSVALTDYSLGGSQGSFSVKDDGSVIWLWNGVNLLVQHDMVNHTHQNISIPWAKVNSTYEGNYTGSGSMFVDYPNNAVYTTRTHMTPGTNLMVYEVHKVVKGNPLVNAVTNLAITDKTSTTITISFTPSDSAETDHYIVYATPRGGNPRTDSATTTTSSPYTITGLTPNTYYLVTVTSVDVSGVAGKFSSVHCVLPGGSTHCLTHSYTNSFNDMNMLWQKGWSIVNQRSSGFWWAGGAFPSVYLSNAYTFSNYSIYNTRLRNGITNDWDVDIYNISNQMTLFGIVRLSTPLYTPNQGLTFNISMGFSVSSVYDFFIMNVGNDVVRVRFTPMNMYMYCPTSIASNGTNASTGKLINYSTNPYVRFSVVFGMSPDGSTIDNQTVLLYTYFFAYNNIASTPTSTSTLISSYMSWIKLSAPITSNTYISSVPNDIEIAPCLRIESLQMNMNKIRFYNYSMTPSQIISDYQTENTIA